ncbi:MAG: sulfocyanin-like copper-binding protein, partial [Acidimicrobiia bacterium]
SGGKPVAVTLKDYSVMASPDSVAAGEVTFTVKNDGSFVHEMLVIKADSPAALPLKADGTVNEDALGEESIPGEASDINPGATAKLTLKLSAGKYLLVCNRVDGTKRHYHEGMVTSFTVV